MSDTNLIEGVTIPDSPSGLQDMLNDAPRMRKVFANPNAFEQFVTAYANKVVLKDAKLGNDTIDRQVEEGTQRFLNQWLKDHQSELQASNLKKRLIDAQYGSAIRTKGAGYSKRAPGAKLDSLEQFQDMDMTDLINMIKPTNRTPEAIGVRSKIDEIQNSFGSMDPASGGFLIPEVLRSQLLAVALESAVVRPRATVIPMDSLRVPIPMIDTTTNSGSVFGGIIAYWTEEASAITESQAAFGRVVLDAQKLAAFAKIPNELAADASAFGGFVEARFPQALSFFEDVAFLKGSGAGEPLGLLGNAATVTAAAVTGQGANTIVWENIVAMYSRMLPMSLGSAVWLAGPDTLPQLLTMGLSVGTGGVPVWLSGTNGPVGGGAGAPVLTLLGRPVIVTEKLQPLGTAGDINFVDLSYYLIGDRQAMQIDTSPHYLFQNDQVAIRVIERVDGRPWLQSAITPQNGSSTTLSAFVNLSSTRT